MTDDAVRAWCVEMKRILRQTTTWQLNDMDQQLYHLGRLPFSQQRASAIKDLANHRKYVARLLGDT